MGRVGSTSKCICFVLGEGWWRGESGRYTRGVLDTVGSILVDGEPEQSQMDLIHADVHDVCLDSGILASCWMLV